jgi:hypothetical protein
MKTPRIATEGIHKCDSCEKLYDAIDLEAIEDLALRVDAGGTVPSGECPDCHALCYPFTKPRPGNSNLLCKGRRQAKDPASSQL